MIQLTTTAAIYSKYSVPIDIATTTELVKYFGLLPGMGEQEVKGECEHIGDTSICSQEEIFILKFPKRFVEIFSRDLTSFTISTSLII
jgi:hypothetical protein